MSLWTKIETAPASAAWFSWKLRFGKELPKVRPLFLKKIRGRAESVPCPGHCGCPHLVTEENVGVCNCGDCEPIPLTAADVEVWQPNWTSLGNKVRDGFDLEHKACEFSVAMVWQVGSFGGGALPIILIVQPDRVAFNEAIAQLVARVPGRFVVLTPTDAFHDIESRELLGRVHAGLHDLESNMTVLPSGVLVPVKSAGELFSPYLPEIRATQTASEAQRIFAMLLKLKSKRVGMKAPLYDVFVLLVLEDASQTEVARECRCSKATVSARVKELESEFERSIKQLKAFAKPLNELQRSVKRERKPNKKPGSAGGKFADEDDPDGREDGAPKEEYGYDQGDRDG